MREDWLTVTQKCLRFFFCLVGLLLFFSYFYLSLVTAQLELTAEALVFTTDNLMFLAWLYTVIIVIVTVLFTQHVFFCLSSFFVFASSFWLNVLLLWRVLSFRLFPIYMRIFLFCNFFFNFFHLNYFLKTFFYFLAFLSLVFHLFFLLGFSFLICFF